MPGVKLLGAGTQPVDMEHAEISILLD